MSRRDLPEPSDAELLDALQDNIPLVPRPWKAIAGRLGIPEEDLLTRLGKLRDEGIIRGISPVLDSRPMGLRAATLVALPVPADRLEETAAIISSYPEVSHNFQRDDHYSLWFTLSAVDEETLRRILADILGRTGIPETDVLDLSTVRKFKADVRFPFVPGKREGMHGTR